MSTFAEWAPYNNYVQGGLTDGRYQHGSFIMLAAGPPRLANLGGAAAFGAALGGTDANQLVYPMGLIQSFNLSHAKQWSRLFELGSRRSYYVGGHTMGQISLGRVHYHGPSLLRLMYAYFQDPIPPVGVAPLFTNTVRNSMANPHDVIVPPGYENIYLNLASDLFDQPVGMLIYQRDVNQATIAGNYAECLVVPNHSFAVDAQGLLIQEQAGGQFERLVPVQVGAAVPVIAGGNSSGADTTFAQAAQ